MYYTIFILSIAHAFFLCYYVKIMERPERAKLTAAKKHLGESRQTIADATTSLHSLLRRRAKPRLNWEAHPDPVEPSLQITYQSSYPIIAPEDTVKVNDTSITKAEVRLTVRELVVRGKDEKTGPLATEEIIIDFSHTATRPPESEYTITLTSDGDARYNDQIVNNFPTEPQQDLTELQKRTTEGLLIAQYGITMLREAGISDMSNRNFRKLTNMVDNRLFFNEETLTSEIAVFLTEKTA